MPRVELRSPASVMACRIDTLNQTTLRRWLDEWVTRLRVGSARGPDAAISSPLLMAVWPLPLDGMGGLGFDWPTDSRFLGVWFPVRGNAADVLLAMEAERDRIEREILAL